MLKMHLRMTMRNVKLSVEEAATATATATATAVVVKQKHLQSLLSILPEPTPPAAAAPTAATAALQWSTTLLNFVLS